jgi:hypothetical protein
MTDLAHTFTGTKKMVQFQGVSLIYGTGQNHAEAAASRRPVKERLIAVGEYSDECAAKPRSLVERAREARPDVPAAEEVTSQQAEYELTQEEFLRLHGLIKEAEAAYGDRVSEGKREDIPRRQAGPSEGEGIPPEQRAPARKVTAQENRNEVATLMSRLAGEKVTAKDLSRVFAEERLPENFDPSEAPGLYERQIEATLKRAVPKISVPNHKNQWECAAYALRPGSHCWNQGRGSEQHQNDVCRSECVRRENEGYRHDRYSL